MFPVSLICCILVLSIDYSDSLSTERHDCEDVIVPGCSLVVAIINYDVGERSVNTKCVCVCVLLVSFCSLWICLQRVKSETTGVKGEFVRVQ